MKNRLLLIATALVLGVYAAGISKAVSREVNENSEWLILNGKIVGEHEAGIPGFNQYLALAQANEDNNVVARPIVVLGDRLYYCFVVVEDEYEYWDGRYSTPSYSWKGYCF